MFNADFYPTPDDLVMKMLYKVGAKRIRSSTILEPSAGKGNILDVMCQDPFTPLRRKLHWERKQGDEVDWDEVERIEALPVGVNRAKCYAIELEPELQDTLRGKGYTLVGTDFLDWHDHIHIDVIVMNPPFSAGSAHLLKAWEVVADGGIVVCLLNAETLRNPHSAERQLLGRLIETHGEVEYLTGAFAEAERATDVDVALVVLNKPARARIQFDGLGYDATLDEAAFVASPLARRDIIGSLVRSYEEAVKALKERFKYRDLYRFHLGTIEDRMDNDLDKTSLNDRVANLKAIFWKYIFDKTQLGKRTTSAFRKDFEAFTAQQSHIAFTEANIIQVLEMFYLDMEGMMLRCVGDTFDQATKYHAKNTVHTEGWKHNKSWKVAPKIILPYGVKLDFMGNFDVTRWHNENAYDFFQDLDKCCCWISGQSFEDTHGIIKAIEGRKFIPDVHGYQLDSTFFHIQLYLKGTVHLTWKDKDLLAKFNQLAAKHKNWLGEGD